MYVWFYSRKINNRFIRFVDLGKYASLITELSNDKSIPKFSTHLIYLTKANYRHEIEEKIIKSIMAKSPKRADIYWFVHINRVEEPHTLNYNVTELVEDKVIKININIGFRIQPKTELYFKKIIQDLIANKELNLHTWENELSKYTSEPDFKFVVIKKFLSVENEFSIRDGIILNSYFFLKRLSLSDENAFGLDKSDIVIEQIPLIYQQANKFELVRKEPNL